MIILAAVILWNIQYGPNWGVYGPYGRPPPGAYDDPPPIRMPLPRPYGPQMEECIYYDDCRGPPQMPPDMPPPRPHPPDYDPDE